MDRRVTRATRPITPVDPIEAFDSANAQTRALWFRPATGEALVGIGSALTLSADVATRLDADRPGPVLMGGFSFDPIAEPTCLWAGFGPAQFIVPERLISLRDGAATLTTTDVVRTARPQLAHYSHTARADLDPTEWKALVAEVACGIRTGELGVRKVVLARAKSVKFSTTLGSALRRLAEGYPTCTIFAFAVGDACFLGATPERLVALRDGTATTMALAGSAPRGATNEDDREIGLRLLADPKERTEHAVVTDALREALAPVCTRLIADAEPHLKKLSNVQHLVTPIRAQVTPGCGVLDLVERLHPTPAVGGYPRERALALIRNREALDRGWYAAPFGWMDARGDGEFVVGLRSALVRGHTATLFAGCGIVGDSDPETESAEWGWKLRPMLAALGLEP